MAVKKSIVATERNGLHTLGHGLSADRHLLRGLVVCMHCNHAHECQY